MLWRRRGLIAVSIAAAATACLSTASAQSNGATHLNVTTAEQFEIAEADTADGQKQAFEAAKELGTAEAWTAFLANYPNGFHADLARAYLKKLSDSGVTPATAAQPAASPPPAPVAAAAPSCQTRSTLKSIESSTPATITFINTSGMYRSILWIDFNGQPKDYANLNSGDQVTQQTFLTHPWMITDGPGNCIEIVMPKPGSSVVQLGAVAGEAASPPRPTVSPSRSDERAQERKKDRERPAVKVKKTKTCGKNETLRKGKCVWKTDKQGFEVKPWEKSGCKTWQKQCGAGNNNACGQYEANCQVN